MKKALFILVILISAVYCSAQTKFLTKNGFISFYSHTPFEDIKAENNQVASILDIGTGDMIFEILMRNFKFDQALMEEHFNENYLESDKYPKAKFKGKITNLSSIDFTKDGTYKADVEGDITIHNTTKKVKISGTFEVKGDKITGASKFELDPKDYNIEIPSVVKTKFADKFAITVNMVYSPLKK
jgi:polyisoprenoid-binding protein YceI